MSSSGTPSHIHWRPIGELLERKNHGRMAMPGFDEEFRDIVDYIIGYRYFVGLSERKSIDLFKKYLAKLPA